MEMGGSWSLGKEALNQEKHRGAVNELGSFFIMGSKGFQDGAGSQYSLPGTWCVLLSFL